MEVINILGLDIGGANTKAALVKFRNSEIFESFSVIEYFPFWEKTLNDIPKMLKRIVAKIIRENNYNLNQIDNISITITAELSDAFQTKREGILIILDALSEVFVVNKLYFINNVGEFIDYAAAKRFPNSIAAANWASTSLFLGGFVSQCILIDAGSTTIDIIPIQFSIPVPIGKDDINLSN